MPRGDAARTEAREAGVSSQTAPAVSDGGRGPLWETEPSIRLVLPLPPSANKSWQPQRTSEGARLVKRAPFRDWMKSASWEVVAQRAGAWIAGHFAARIIFPETAADIDNRIKPSLDACQHGGAIRNDKYCRRLAVEIDDSREGTLLVELWALPGPIPSRRSRPVRKVTPAGKGTNP
jgi:Holliday junction resolvase RusA-like endonuclease